MNNISPVSKSLLTGQTETLLATQALARKHPKRRRWGRWMGVMGLLALGGITVFFWRSGGMQPPPPLMGKTEAVTLQSLTVRVESSGSLEPISTVNVSPKTAGRLAELYVKQGDRVSKGQIVARMDGGTLKAELAQVQAQLAQIQAQYALTKNGTRREEVSQAKAQVAANPGKGRCDFQK
jgi:HlyD family secretion protein